MDYPKSVPSVGLVNGKFVDENPVAGTPGSLIPAIWGNSVTDELLGVIKGAGVTPDEVDLGQLLLAVRKINQSGLVDYAVDTGTANAYRANYAPVVVNLVDGLVLRFKAVNANTGASTFSANDLPAKPIVGVDHNAVQEGEITASGDVWVQWNSSVASGVWVMIASTGMVKQTGSDIGDIKTVATAEPPKGWLKCNGDIVSRTQYAALFAAIGTRFGAGNGSTTFALPDLRGEFVRGWDDGRKVDNARVLGSAQAGQNLSHTHTASAAATGGMPTVLRRPLPATTPTVVSPTNPGITSTAFWPRVTTPPMAGRVRAVVLVTMPLSRLRAAITHTVSTSTRRAITPIRSRSMPLVITATR